VSTVSYILVCAQINLVVERVSWRSAAYTQLSYQPCGVPSTWSSKNVGYLDSGIPRGSVSAWEALTLVSQCAVPEEAMLTISMTIDHLFRHPVVSSEWHEQ